MESAGEICPDFYFKLPNSIAFLGSSKSGKTTMVARFLRYLDKITCECPPIAKLVIAYAHYQPIYEEMIESVRRLYPTVRVQMFDHYPEEQFQSQEFWKVPCGYQTLIILDDLNEEVGKSFEKMLRGTLHHNNASLFYISQCHSSESEVVRKGLRNINYYIILKSSHSGILLSDLNRKIFLYKPKFLISVYDSLLSKCCYPYLIIDLTTSPDQSVKTGVFPNEESYIFKPSAR